MTSGSPAPIPPRTRVVFCDIDGVLHETSLVEGVDLAALATQGADKLLAIGLFGLAEHLENVLVEAGADDVKIAVHSSLRGTVWAPPIIRPLLGSLGARFQGFTSAKLPRGASMHDLCLRIGVGDHLIIDDAIMNFWTARACSLRIPSRASLIPRCSRACVSGRPEDQDDPNYDAKPA